MNYMLQVRVIFLDIYVNPQNRDYLSFSFKFQCMLNGQEDLCSDLLTIVNWYNISLMPIDISIFYC